MKKTLLSIIIVCLLFAACQKTPEEVIVKSKAGEALEEGIQKTASESSVEEITGSEDNKTEELYDFNKSHMTHSAINERW